MIQFNLLPDVKKEYIKAKRTKRLIFTGAFFSSVIAIGVVVIFFTIVQIGQKKYINDMTDDITALDNSIQNTPDIDTMLTVQNQLTVLPGPHDSKPAVDRIFTYLSQVIPPPSKVSSVNLDFASASLAMQGEADSLASVNKVIDTLKSTYYRVGEDSTNTKAFTLTSSRFGGDDKSASFDVTMTFDPVLFDRKQQIQLVIVPVSTTPTLSQQPTGGQ